MHLIFFVYFVSNRLTRDDQHEEEEGPCHGGHGAADLLGGSGHADAAEGLGHLVAQLGKC